MKGAAASAAAPVATAAFLLLAALAGETRAAKLLVFPSQGPSADPRGPRGRRRMFSGDSTDTASTPVARPTDTGCVDVHGCAEARSRQSPSSPAGSFVDSDATDGGSAGDSLVQRRKYRRTGRSRSPRSRASPTEPSVPSSAGLGFDLGLPELREEGLRQGSEEDQSYIALLDVIREAFGQEAAQRLEENGEVMAQLQACPRLQFHGAAPSSPADFLERYLRSLGLPRLVNTNPEPYSIDELSEEAIEDFGRFADEALLEDVTECASAASLVAMSVADPADRTTQASLAALERLYLEEECRSSLPSPSASIREAAQRWDTVVFGFRVQQRHACAHKAALAGLADLTARGAAEEEQVEFDEKVVERVKAMLFAALDTVQPRRSDHDDGEVVQVPELEEWWHDLGLSYEDLDSLEDGAKHKISSSDPRRRLWKFVQRMKPCDELLAKAQANAPGVAQALGQRCAGEAPLRAAAAAASLGGAGDAEAEGGFEEFASKDLISQDLHRQAPVVETSESLLEASRHNDWGAAATRGNGHAGRPAGRAGAGAGASASASASGGSCPVFQLTSSSDPWLALDEYLLRLTPLRDTDGIDMAPRVRCADEAFAAALAMVERQGPESAGVQKAQLKSLRYFHPDLFPSLKGGASEGRTGRANGLLRQRACPQLELRADIVNGLDEYLVSLDRIGPLASLDEYPAWQRRCAALVFEAAKEAAEQVSPRHHVEMQAAISDIRRFHPLLFPEFAESLPAQPPPRRLRTRGAADEEELYDEVRGNGLLQEV